MAWNNIKEIANWIGNINEPNNYRTNLYFLIDIVNKMNKYTDIEVKDLNAKTEINASEFWQYLGVIYQKEHDELKNNFFSYSSSPSIRISINVDSKILQEIKKPEKIEYKNKPNIFEPESHHWKLAFEKCVNDKTKCGNKNQQETKCILILH